MATHQTVAVYQPSTEASELFPPEAEQLQLIPTGTYGADCLVCGLMSRFPLNRPQVCDLCAEDMPRARDHIATLRTAAQARLTESEAAYQLAVATAGPAERARLGTLELLRANAMRSAVARHHLHIYLNTPERYGEAWASLVRLASSRISTLYIVQVQLSRCDRADTALNLLEGK